MLPCRALSLIIFILISVTPIGLVRAQDLAQTNPGKGRFIIDSDSMELTHGGKSIIFLGNVVTREEFTLCSDELRVKVNDKREIIEIIAIGSVRLLQGGKVATADRAEYDKEARVIVFTGNSKIVSCGDTISGEKIRYNMDSGSALVEGGEGGRVRALMISEKNCTEDTIIEKDFCRGAR